MLFMTLTVSAQRNIAPLLSVQTEYKPVAGNPALFTIQLKITLLETVNIEKVIVKMGIERDSSDLLLKEFIFDQSGTFSDGTSYSRTGKKITLGLGTYDNMEHFNGEVKIFKTDNTFSDPITFSR